MKYARTACSFIDRVEPIRITAPPGLQLFSRRRKGGVPHGQIHELWSRR